MSKNIGFIIPGLKNGGAERVLSTISLNLDKEFNQYIFTWNGKEKDYDFNAKIVEIDTQNSKNLLKNIFVLFKRVREVKKYKRQFNIDTCISHLEGPNIVNLMSKGKEKTIITVHNFQSKERKGLYGFIFKTLIKITYNKADKIVVVSKAIKEDLIRNFNIDDKKIKVIYNPFDCKLIEKLSRENLENSYEHIFDSKVIINVGRLTEQKGQWHLIKAFSEIKRQEKDVKLVILGQGELESCYKELVERLHIENDVYFLGFQKNPFKFISKANIFVLSSLYEGFPMCIAEAMACGTPVLSVDCKSGPNEILSENKNIMEEVSDIKYDEYGILVPKFTDSKKNIDLVIREEDKKFSQFIMEAIKNEMKLNEYKLKVKNKVRNFAVDNIILEWNELI